MLTHARQCVGCGFTFGGCLAIGSPLCGPCIDIARPALVWAVTAPLADLRTGAGRPWTGPQRLVLTPANRL
jgi:hypothetical protein